MKFKKIPEDKFSWLRVEPVISLSLHISCFVIIMFDLYSFMPEMLEIISDYPDIHELSFRHGVLSMLLTILLFYFIPHSIKRLKECKDNKEKSDPALEGGENNAN